MELDLEQAAALSCKIVQTSTLEQLEAAGAEVRAALEALEVEPVPMPAELVAKLRRLYVEHKQRLTDEQSKSYQNESEWHMADWDFPPAPYVHKLEPLTRLLSSEQAAALDPLVAWLEHEGGVCEVSEPISGKPYVLCETTSEGRLAFGWRFGFEMAHPRYAHAGGYRVPAAHGYDLESLYKYLESKADAGTTD